MQLVWGGVEIGLHQGGFGVQMARRPVRALVAGFVAAGGEYRMAAIEPPTGDGPLETVRTSAGGRIAGREFVFACGPGLPKLFPQLLSCGEAPASGSWAPRAA